MRINRKDFKTNIEWPSIDIIMLISRPQKGPYYMQALTSAVNSIYPGKLGLIEIDNLDKSMSIGKGFNLGVVASDADFVYFLGDDDFISNDLLISSACMANHVQNTHRIDPVFIGSGFISVDAENNMLEVRSEQPTGMWLRSFVMEHKFDESLEKLVDTDLMNRTKALNQPVFTMPQHFGYFYRQHEGMISGQKTTVLKPVT